MADKNNLRRQCGNGRDVRNIYPLGADIVKVGNWSWLRMHDACKTGVGYPQLSAVIEC